MSMQCNNMRPRKCGFLVLWVARRLAARKCRAGCGLEVRADARVDGRPDGAWGAAAGQAPTACWRTGGW